MAIEQQRGAEQSTLVAELGGDDVGATRAGSSARSPTSRRASVTQSGFPRITEPPSTSRSGLKMLTMSTAADASAARAPSSTVRASSSPAAAAAATASPLIGRSGCRRSSDAMPESSARPAAAASAGPAAMASRQPFLPHPQTGPSGETLMWPSSPATPSAPRNSRSSRMTAPPTPVDTVTYTRLVAPRPAPYRCSASAEAFVSRSTTTGRPRASDSCSPSRNPSSPGPVFGGRNSAPSTGLRAGGADPDAAHRPAHVRSHLGKQTEDRLEHGRTVDI